MLARRSARCAHRAPSSSTVGRAGSPWDSFSPSHGTERSAAASGHLLISAPAGFGRQHVAPLLPSFLAEHRDVSLTLNLNDRMVDLIGEAIDQGARGFTTGLSYAPGLFASVDELTALAGAAATRGRPYHTHMRYGPDGVVASVREALLTAERSGVELNISLLDS